MIWYKRLAILLMGMWVIGMISADSVSFYTYGTLVWLIISAAYPELTADDD